MKKFLLAITAMFATMSMSAQFPQFKPEDMVKRQVDQMKETCKLDDAQYKKVFDYMLAQNKAMMARMDSIRNAGGQMQFDPADMQKRQEEQNKALKAILTEEQFAAYQKAQQERMERMRQGGFGGGFGGQR